MPSYEKDLARLRQRIARLAKIPTGRDGRPTLWHWMWEGIDAKSGPFLLDALTATAVYRSACFDWSVGLLAGPEPTPTEIGRTFRQLGAVAWRPEGVKMWLLPGRDHEAARLKGPAYWYRRIKHVEHGGYARWEPDLLCPKLKEARRAKTKVDSEAPPIWL